MPPRAQQAELVKKAASGGKGPERRQLLDQKIDAARRAQAIYAMAFKRWKAVTDAWFAVELPLRDRLAAGLGQDSVLEVGIMLHHTYGVPVIRGSALKGLAAHYCDRVWGKKDPAFRLGEGSHTILFGTTDSSGYITFHDGWITPESLMGKNQGIVPDVMTPHHGPYYMSSDETAPTDFDDPNPVSFLSVAGTFRFAIECADMSEQGREWGRLALELLKQALTSWGAGGKTNAGYGRFAS
ncbi:MAG: type III-B CRISPR module RAMP protein Cmr6 [Acidobacteria bacterium]|nr:type III-B CRISPR module RAMP protein Cmr6 [Acidobacteriota bacterium]